MTHSADTQVKADLARLLPLVEPRLGARLPQNETVAKAMAYSLEAGGKRVRPVLCMLTAEALGQHPERALSCALALEYIHTYSLIHDDLPAMDNDDLRRGKPTCHVVFGEGQAILAGDGLLTEAFQLLAEDASLSPQTRVEAIAALAEAAGWRGMVGGQSLDLEGEILTQSGQSYDLPHLQRIHRLKTGALLRASLELGGIACEADATQREALRRGGAALGMAFQIQDDILDATSTTEAMGKRVGKDQDHGKITYPRLMGLDGARRALAEVTQQAIEALSPLPHPGSLIAWAHYLAERTA
ncbi:MAG: polyprenyl synthetase family protein [Firmicutes bacterium]|nr:polyprenyl synthetase family protein [Bacillota bacterium]